MKVFSKHEGYAKDGIRLHHKGGSSSTTTSEIPPELKPLAAAYTNKALDLSQQSFNPYTGQRYADLNPTQQAALGMVQQRATGGNPLQQAAESSLQQTIQGQTNPYLDSMVNKAQQSVLGTANQAAVRSGSFGNSGIAEQAARQMSDVATSMYGGAYEADAARRLQATSMAPTISQAGYQDAAQLLNAGQVAQNQQQQNQDFAYQQFQEQQNLPYKQLAAMAGPFGSNLGMSQSTTESGGK